MGNGCSSVKSIHTDNPSQSNIKAKKVPALKIAIVGDKEVGKTSIFLRYVRNQFSPLYIPTQRAVIENYVHKVNLPAHAVVSLSLWDIPGQEDVDLYKSYFRNLDAAIVVVDASDADSIMLSNVWKQIVLTNVTKNTKSEGNGEPSFDKQKFPVLLLGNKCDIVDQQLQAEGKSLYPVGKKLKDTKFSKLEVKSDNESVSDEVMKPECVQQLEKMAEEHQFVGSVIVSARDGDGSVHMAIQSFIRHILEDQYLERRWKTRAAISQKQKPENSKLETIGIEMIDNAFGGKSVEAILDRIHRLKSLNEKSLKKFQSQCVDVDVVSDSDGGVVNCILALRKLLNEADFKLQLVEEDSTFYLRVEFIGDGEPGHMTKALKNILQTFNNEYGVSSMLIQQEFSPLEERLSRIDARVACLVAGYEEPVEPGSEASVIKDSLKVKSSKIEKNRGVLQHYRNQACQSREDVDSVLSRIKTAFIW